MGGTYSPRSYTYDAIRNLTSKTGVGSYSYNGAFANGSCTSGTSAVKPHAVDTAGSGTYAYDCDGNMTARNIGSGNYTLTYNAENQLYQCKQGSTVLAAYTYDGDGTLVKKVAGGRRRCTWGRTTRRT